MSKITPADKATQDISLFCNEQKVDIPTGYYIQLDINGNETDFTIPIFEKDLGTNETIIKQFEVELKPNPFRNSIILKLINIFTCGFYLWILRTFASCRARILGVTRARMAITSQGRLGVWKSHVLGSEKGGSCFNLFRGKRTLLSHTEVSWYRVADISHFQHVHKRQFDGCICSREKMWESSLRIFFGPYPDQSIVDAINFTYVLPKTTVTMNSGLSPAKIESHFDVRSYFMSIGKGAIKSVKKLISMSGLAFQLSEAMMLEVTVTEQSKSNEESSFQQLLDIQRTLLQVKNSSQTVMAPANPRDAKFREEHKPLVDDDGRINLHVGSIAFMEGEEVVAALPYTIRWTLTEILLTLVTVGLYWYFVVRHRHSLQMALVLTRSRLVEVAQRSLTGDRNEGPYYVQMVRSWFLDGLETGCLCRERVKMWAMVQTGYGALTVSPSLENDSWFETRCYGINPALHTRGKEFLLNFSYIYLSKVYNDAPEVKIPSNLIDDMPRQDGETNVGYLRSFGVQTTGLACGALRYAPPVIQYLLSCGVFPYDANQELILTSHRIWAIAKPENDPWCCSKILQPKYYFIFWTPLLGKSFLGTKLSGDVNVKEHCGTQLLPCFFSPVSAGYKYSLAFSFSRDQKGFPINLIAYQENAKKGLMDKVEVGMLRQTLGSLQAAKMNNYSEATVNAFSVDLPPKYNSYHATWDPSMIQSHAKLKKPF